MAAWGTATFDQNGGTGGEQRTLYYEYEGRLTARWAQMIGGSLSQIYSCSVPTKEGYNFKGYYLGDEQWVGTDGIVGTVVRTHSLYVTSSVTLVAKWSKSWKITFNLSRGTGGTNCLYYKTNGGGFYLDEELSQPATSIVAPTYGDHPFSGYFSNSSHDVKYINSDGSFTSAFTSLTITGDITIYAGWEHIIEDDDYFTVTDANLMLVDIDSGATRSVVETAGSTGSGNNLKAGCLAIQTADSANGAFWKGDVLVNPKCTYRIRGSGNVSFQLGKSWNTAKGKFFLTKVEYKTGADKEPVLVLHGTANEGADAINLWTVTFAVSPDHVAQDPYGAITGGGEMTECNTVASCDPVVPYENGLPCASDIVHGKVTVTARTNAYFGESAPEANSSNGFIETNGTPDGMTDVDFSIYEITAERSL